LCTPGEQENTRVTLIDFSVRLAEYERHHHGQNYVPSLSVSVRERGHTVTTLRLRLLTQLLPPYLQHTLHVITSTVPNSSINKDKGKKQVTYRTFVSVLVRVEE